jgi:hypothetical protein
MPPSTCHLRRFAATLAATSPSRATYCDVNLTKLSKQEAGIVASQHQDQFIGTRDH